MSDDREGAPHPHALTYESRETGSPVMVEGTRCPKCGGAMELGFLLDQTDGGNTVFGYASRWVSGLMELRFWGGVKIRGRRFFRVSALRCQGCGFLEMYANDPVQ